MSNNPQPNPFIGPRAFEVGEILYGRDRELRQITAQLISERIVLLHSPSGAGKTSLIKAGLIPLMRREKFHVLPVVRVNLEPDLEVTRTPRFNRYIYSVMLSLEEGLPGDQRHTIADLVGLNLAIYLNERPRSVDAPHSNLLIFDQFEEILTVRPTDREGKQAFFAQLGKVLRSSNCWALFAIREDYLGALAPYVRPIPNRLEVTFRLDLLGYEAAIDAIRKPASDVGVDFTAKAAHKLVDNLRSTHVQQPDGQLETVLGPNVEPVQLQVVCFRLWERREVRKNNITLKDVASVGNVDRSLADYYATSVARVAQETGVDQRNIRQWFDNKLITKEGVRGQVLMGGRGSGGLDNTAIRLLENTHLIRSEKRAGKTWFELAHDRLIDPLRKNNAAWFEENLRLFQRQAVVWDQQGRSEGLLLRGKDLVKAEVESNTIRLTKEEQEFLEACRALRKREHRERRQNLWTRLFALSALIAMVVTCAAIIFALLSGFEVVSSREQAQISLAGNLAALSQSYSDSLPVPSSLLALESMELTSPTITPQQEQALRSALQNLGGTRLITQDADLGIIYNLESDPQGNWLAATGWQGTYLWTSDGSPIGSLPGATTSPYQIMQVSHNGKWLVASSDDGKVWLWRMDTGSPFLVDLPNSERQADDLSFSPDDQWLAAGDSNGVRMWNLSSDDPVFVDLPEQKEASDLQFSPMGKWLISHGVTGIALWNIGQGGPIPIPLESFQGLADFIDFSADDNWLAISNTNALQIWNLQSGVPVLTSIPGYAGIPRYMAFSPTGPQWLAIADQEGVTLRDMESGNTYPLALPDGHQSAENLVFANNGKWLVAGESGDIWLWDLTSPQPSLNQILLPDQVYEPDFDPAGEFLISFNFPGTIIYLWDLSSLKAEPLSLRGHENFIITYSFSPDSNTLLTGSADGIIRRWNLAVPMIEPVVRRGYGKSIISLDVSPNGQWLVTGDEGGSIRLWSANDPSIPPVVLAGSPGYSIVNVSFSEDGRWLAAGSYSGQTWLWDMQAASTISGQISSPREVEIEDSNAPVVLSPSYKGRWLAGTGYEGNVRLWDLANIQAGAQILSGTEYKKKFLTSAMMSVGWRLAARVLGRSAYGI